jgi:D-serine deaminase-like pyridoxal phosphate-dependent protein
MKQTIGDLRRGPNVHLIGAPNSRVLLATPALLLDLDAFEHNVALMSRCCREVGLGLRPHAKAHKCTRIAARQQEAGAVGVCAATVREAEAMVAAGIAEVLVTSPIVGGTKIASFCSLVGCGTELIAVVDSIENVQLLDMALPRDCRRVSALVDIDVGMKRTGVPTVGGAVALACRLQQSRSLKFAGVQCYSGLVQHIAGASERAAAYGAELKHLEAVLHELKRAGLPPQIVSGGGTGTFDIDRRARLLTEVQPGSYIFMDLHYGAVDLFANDAQPFKKALFVQSIVLSNQHGGRATIDAGVKSFAMDGPVPIPTAGAPAGAQYYYDGDEFGLITFPQPYLRLELGSKIEFVAPHCDPTVNLHDFYHCVRGDVLVDIWPVDARGSL